MKKLERNQPFYLNIATQEPHACTWKEVGSRIPGMPAHWPDWMPPGMPTTPALLAAFRRFAAAVVFLDQEFGRLMQGLKSLDLLQNTLVVFTTDHGMSGPRGKGTLYRLGTEIALIMRLPDSHLAGSEFKLPVSNISFRSTLAEAVGVSTVDHPQGASIWSAILNPEERTAQPVFLERNFHGEKPWHTEQDYIDCYDPIRAARTDRFLYLKNFLPQAKPPEPLNEVINTGLHSWHQWEQSWQLPSSTRPKEELYDLTLDPHELKNVADDPQYGTQLQELRKQTSTWMQSTADFLPCDPPQRPEPPGWGPYWPPISHKSD
ncbi:MAG: sulfatase-like hydrolase/transferase [Verrucomicrobia bacterium]|nr:sulfatase-like hydrolase/transferase [Verrucomicrobiota bacterium]